MRDLKGRKDRVKWCYYFLISIYTYIKNKKDSRLKSGEEIAQTKYKGNNRITNKIGKLRVEKLTIATKQWNSTWAIFTAKKQRYTLLRMSYT